MGMLMRMWQRGMSENMDDKGGILKVHMPQNYHGGGDTGAKGEETPLEEH